MMVFSASRSALNGVLECNRFRMMALGDALNDPAQYRLEQGATDEQINARLWHWWRIRDVFMHGYFPGVSSSKWSSRHAHVCLSVAYRFASWVLTGTLGIVLAGLGYVAERSVRLGAKQLWSSPPSIQVLVT